MPAEQRKALTDEELAQVNLDEHSILLWMTTGEFVRAVALQRNHFPGRSAPTVQDAPTTAQEGSHMKLKDTVDTVDLEIGLRPGAASVMAGRKVVEALREDLTDQATNRKQRLEEAWAAIDVTDLDSLQAISTELAFLRECIHGLVQMAPIPGVDDPEDA